MINMLVSIRVWNFPYFGMSVGKSRTPTGLIFSLKLCAGTLFALKWGHRFQTLTKVVGMVMIFI
jgi:hypothetical protein